MSSYVTGIGVISAIGKNVKENLEALLAKRTGISCLTLFESTHDVPVGELKLSNEELQQMLGLPITKTYSRTALLGMVAVKEALTDAGIKTNSGLRIGLISSTSAGGMDLSELLQRDACKAQWRTIT